MISIYELYTDLDNEVYVGSTCKNPYVRLLQHKIAFLNQDFACSSSLLFKKNTQVNVRCIEICGEPFRMETEKYWIKNTPNCINKNNYSTEYEGYQVRYQKKNKDRLCERIKCDCGSIISRKNISTHKKNETHHRKLKIIELNQDKPKLIFLEKSKINESIDQKCCLMV